MRWRWVWPALRQPGVLSMPAGPRDRTAGGEAKLSETSLSAMLVRSLVLAQLF